MKIFSLILLSSFVAPVVHAKKLNCHYDWDPQSLVLEWTAFKTTQKVAVSGKLGQVEVSGFRSKSSVQESLKGVQAKIQLASAEDSVTGNPGRDQTLFQNFFSKLKPAKDARFTAKVLQIVGSNFKGNLKVALTFNGKKRILPMTYTRDEEGVFEAKGSFDLLKWNAKDAHDSIHNACLELHKGADGVSKTWSDVEVKVTGKLPKRCDP